MIVLNPFLDSLCNFGFKNIGLTPGIPKGCFQHPQDVVHDFDEDILKTQLQIFSKNFPLKEQLSIIDIENYFKELEPSSRKLLGKGKTRPQAPSHALRRPHTPSALPDPKPHALSWL